MLACESLSVKWRIFCLLRSLDQFHQILQYESQFVKDKTSIGTTPLTSMTIDMVNSDPVSQKPYPITMKH